jgi:hypothetical protein
MRAMNRKNYPVAIREFQSSYDFFTKHLWLDRFRAFTMMSPSVWSYREMALMNIAAVHAAQKDFDATEAACQRVLDEFPDNEVARNTMDSTPKKGGAEQARTAE